MKVKLSNVRLSFPDLFHAKEFKTGDGKPRFNATFLIEPGSEQDKAIEAAIKAAAVETHGPKADKFLAGVRGNANKCSYLDGDAKEYDGYEGMMYLSCHSKTKPAVFTHRKVNGKVCHLNETGDTFQMDEFGKLVPVEVDFEVRLPFAGGYVNATVDIFATKGDFPGVFASFSGVQWCGDGPAFGGGGKGAVPDDFDEVTDGAGADDFS